MDFSEPGETGGSKGKESIETPTREKQAGRGVLVTVRQQGSAFIGEQDSLTTKCPSKYQAASASY